MASTGDELPTVVYGDIENLHKELEQLAASVASSISKASEHDQHGNMPAATITFRGK